MSEETLEIKKKKRGWESVVLRILKWTTILGVLVFILFTILSRMGGNSDVLRTAIEDFLTQNTPYTARITRLNHMNFFPDIIIDVENVELRGGEEGLGETEIRIGAAKFAVGFFDVVFSKDGFKNFQIERLTARPGAMMSQPVELEFMNIRDDEQGAALVGKGNVGSAPLEVQLNLKTEGEARRKTYRFGDNQGFNASLANVKMSGALEENVLGDLKLNNFKLTQGEQPVLQGNFDLDRKGRGRFSVKGQSVLEPTKSALDVDVTLDFGAEPHSINGRIKSDALHVEDFASDAPLMTVVNALSDIFGEDDKDILDLSGSNLDLKIDVASLKAGALNWGSVSTPVTLEGSVLKVGPLDGDISGGVLSGDMTLSSAEAPAKLESKIMVKGFDYAALQKQVVEQAEIEGRGDILVTLEAKGQSMDQILEGLSGKANFVGGRGKLRSGLLDIWGGGLLNVLLPSFEEEAALNVNCVVINTDIEGLKARSDAVFVDTQKVTLQGEGTYDFADDQMEMVLEPKPKDVAIGDISSAVNVSGPLSDLSVSPNVFDLGKKVGGLLLGAVNPAFYAVTLADLGLNDDHPCKAFVIERETLEEPEMQKESEEEVEQPEQQADEILEVNE